MRTPLSVFLLIAMCLAGAGSLPEARAAEPEALLRIFHSPGCSHCLKAKREVFPLIEKRFSGRIRMLYLDIDKIEHYQLLLSLLEFYKPAIGKTIPVLELNGKFLEAQEKGVEEVSRFIEEALSAGAPAQPHLLPQVDLLQRFRSFTPALVASAGFIDGFNPCAFTVVVFFMSFLAAQGYRRRELAVVGGAFVAAVFGMYLLLGVGIFNFIFALRGYGLAVKVFTVGLGAASVLLGIAAVYDLVLFLRTRSSEGLLLQLPEAVKKQIHRVIGERWRRGTAKAGEAVRSNPWKMAFGAFLTGCAVSLLEAVCTGQAYLPTIGFVLTQSRYRVHAAGYLLLYNVMFILPLCAVFLAALAGAGSSVFARFLQRWMPLIKILMALMFFGFGFFLLTRA
jgi:cytochrome c biogenesis protein CcdA/glutaredoxin